MTLPNQLTVFRVVLIPVFVLLLVYDLRVYALIVFVLTGISDGLDGYIARAWRQQTTLGTILDPIADKLLMVTTFVTLAFLRALPFALTATLIGRDVILSLVFGIVLFLSGRRIAGPTFLGKTALIAEMSTVILGLVFYVFDQHPISQALKPFILQPVFILTVILALVSGFHYLYQVVHLFHAVEGSIKRQMPVR
jgi:cardiolipin synthase